MSPAENALLRQAVNGLQIKDIVLRGANFKQHHPLPKKRGAEIEQQNREGWGLKVTKAGRAVWLQVYYRFGTRLAEIDNDGESDQKIYFALEAEFVAHFQINDPTLPKSAIQLFAAKNAKHNIWPFWRQHVFDVCQKARLTPPEIPLFPG
jgi:hypothetical protein